MPYWEGFASGCIIIGQEYYTGSLGIWWLFGIDDN